MHLHMTTHIVSSSVFEATRGREYLQRPKEITVYVMMLQNRWSTTYIHTACCDTMQGRVSVDRFGALRMKA
jgi:hypothetical protein